jgi:hypothetical protein
MRSRIDSCIGSVSISRGVKNPTSLDSSLVVSRPPRTRQAKQRENSWRTSPSPYSTTWRGSEYTPTIHSGSTSRPVSSLTSRTAAAAKFTEDVRPFIRPGANELDTYAPQVKEFADDAFRFETGSWIPWVYKDLDASRQLMDSTLRIFKAIIDYADDMGALEAEFGGTFRSEVDQAQDAMAAVRNQWEQTRLDPEPPMASLYERAGQNLKLQPGVPHTELMRLMRGYNPKLFDPAGRWQPA